MMLGISLVLLSLCVLSAPAAAAFLDANLTTGVFRGVNTGNGTERWLGIPFAEPPEGELRFKAPVPITTRSEEVIHALSFGKACPQPPSPSLGADVGENCLHLSVWRPCGTTSESSLPVLIWIYGGAFTTGSSANPAYDPTRIVNRSASTGKPIIVVSINYRVNTFGFLASGTVAAEDLNAGLLDQRLALEFVQDNIAAFGGDPMKVTIWGESAGAGSVHSHFVFPSDKPLFRAGIANSATGPFKNTPVASKYDEPGKPFARLLASANCSDANDVLACLRDVPFEILQSISNIMIANTLNGQLWEPAVGAEGSFMPVRASTKIQAGDFLHLPWVGGTNLNEGKSFSRTLLGQSLTGDAQNDALDTFIRALLIDESTVTQETLDVLHELYREDDTTLGAPFNTGDSLFDRAASFYTDEFFLAPRRLFFEHGSALQPMWAYYFGEFIPGNNATFGVAHASELVLLLGPGPPEEEIEFANQWIDFYVNFVNDLNPGDVWPQYNNSTKEVLFLQRENITAISDDWDTDKTVFLNSQKVLDEFEK